MKSFGIFLLVTVLLAGCEAPVVEPTQRAVRFRVLPPYLGGGISSIIEQPGKVIRWPWDVLYLVDVHEQTLSLEKDRAVRTALPNGNPAALEAALRFKVSESPEALENFVQRVGTESERLEALLEAQLHDAAARAAAEYGAADINNPSIKQNVEAVILTELQRRLRYTGITPLGVQVFLKPYENTLPKEQERHVAELRDVQEKVARYKEDLAQLRSAHDRSFLQTKMEVEETIGRARAEAERIRQRADADYRLKEAEAQAMQKAAELEVEGLRERINALSGPGGRALLKLELSKQLLKENPKFAVVESEGNISHTDTNQLLEQMKVFEKEGEKK